MSTPFGCRSKHRSLPLSARCAVGLLLFAGLQAVLLYFHLTDFAHILVTIGCVSLGVAIGTGRSALLLFSVALSIGCIEGEHPAGYEISQWKRKAVEQVFGWMKTVGNLRKTRHRGTERVGWMFTFGAAAYNLVRMRNLLAEAPG